jgi:hypothetical protein
MKAGVYTCTRWALRRVGRDMYCVVQETRSGSGFKTVDSETVVATGMTKDEAIEFLKVARRGQ